MSSNAVFSPFFRLSAGQGLRIDSGELRNDAGLIQAGEQLALDTHSQQLSNAQSASYANAAAQSGGILSGGFLELNAGAVNNQGGVIGAEGKAPCKPRPPRSPTRAARS